MRSNFSQSGIWSYGYLSLTVMSSGLYLFYLKRKQVLSLFYEDVDYEITPRFADGFGFDSNIMEERSLLMTTLLMVVICSFTLFRLTRIVHRGYYSPTQMKFIFIRPNYLMPWRPRRTVCKPGDAIPVNPKYPFLRFVSSTVKINGKKLYIDPNYFFLQAYHDVLCGYLPPKIVSNTILDPDVSFREIVRGDKD